MPLSWNEIRGRGLAFAREWADESTEDADAKSFRDGPFNIFGATRRVAFLFGHYQQLLAAATARGRD